MDKVADGCHRVPGVASSYDFRRALQAATSSRAA